MPTGLEMTGLLLGRTLLRESWDEAGVHVEADGDSIRVSWLAAPDASEASWEAMERQVQDRLAIEVIEVGIPLRVQWTSRHATHPVTGVATTTGHAHAASWIAARGPVLLATHGANAAKLDRHPVLRSAIAELERAMEVWEGEAIEALGRLYRAVEGLVQDARGASGEKARGDYGVAIGYGRDETLQLWNSLQFGRHVNAQFAAARLASMGRPALDPNQCMTSVRAIVSAALARAP